MTRLVHLLARLRAFVRPDRLDRELDEELESHLAMLADEHVRRGLAPEAARRAARIAQSADSTQLREAHRDTRGLPFVETLLQDLRYAVRTLRRDAGFTTFAVLIVGLGIGASATVFSVVNAIAAPAAAIQRGGSPRLDCQHRRRRRVGSTVPVFHFIDLRDQNHAFADIDGLFRVYDRATAS